MASDRVARIAAVVFDLDGVLIDSHAAVVSATNQALVENGFSSRSPHELRRFIGPPVFEAFEELTGEPRDSPIVATVVERYHEHYQRVYLDQTVLMDGIAPVLSTLSTSRRLAIATSKPDMFVEPLLVVLGVRPFFRAIAAPSVSARDEDKAGTLARALSELGTHRAAMVGDRAFDIEAAHVHGLPAIGVTWGVGSIDELRSAGAEAIASKPADLIPMLTEAE
jgi:phosphoglycolate phosphatase